MASTKSENEESIDREDEASDDAGEESSDEERSDEEGAGDDEGSDDEGSDDEGSDDEGSDDEGSDDEGSDDEGSDDEGSDDEGSDDEGSDDAPESEAGAGEGEAAEAAAPATKKPKSGKGPRQYKKDGMTAGARLAAAKAAKAARKAAKLGKEKKSQDPMTQVRESPLAKKAEEASSWAKQNPTLVWALVAALVLGLGGWMGWRYYTEQQARAAAALLEEALEIVDAEIVEAEEESEDEDDEDAPPTFASEQERADAALAAFRRVLTDYPSSDAARWARLGEARVLFERGEHEEAREAYDRAADEGGSDPAVVWRALEGKAFTLEAAEQWAEALAVYEELARIDGGRFEPVAKYHIARMYLAQGDRSRATDTLRTLVESLREAEEDEDAQDFEYVLAQAQTRLRELDPSAAPPPRGARPVRGRRARRRPRRRPHERAAPGADPPLPAAAAAGRRPAGVS
ncbi:MAG: tetratricopeptide repeat protein [Sandaracinaceae bacterium]|nr:tetratricopeptide repeat protein [Sandaracinaceae bacterium]